MGPTLENRWQVIHLIRSYHPDLILTHRPNDYHPDHRYTSQLVQDAAYMITVPAVVPGTKHLLNNPVIAYLPDEFQKPYPFSPTIAVDVGPVIEKIVDMLHCHVSQFYEWLAYNTQTLEQVPIKLRSDAPGSAPPVKRRTTAQLMRSAFGRSSCNATATSAASRSNMPRPSSRAGQFAAG